MKIDNNTSKAPTLKTAVGKVCCGVLEKMNLGWMTFPNGDRVMPHIEGYSDSGQLYRVNYCPSCGKHIRSIIIKFQKD